MSAGAAPQRIVFGLTRNATTRAFRHVDAMGLDREEVMQAIVRDLEPHLPMQSPANNMPHQGSVMLRGLLLRYHAFPLVNGIVNVGRVTPG